VRRFSRAKYQRVSARAFHSGAKSRQHIHSYWRSGSVVRSSNLKAVRNVVGLSE
jgi:hypothetical protein